MASTAVAVVIVRANRERRRLAGINDPNLPFAVNDNGLSHEK